MPKDPHPLIESAKQRYVAGQVEVEELELLIEDALLRPQSPTLAAVDAILKDLYVDRQGIRGNFEKAERELKRLPEQEM